MSHFRDHFSASAEKYASYRPSYPPALFDWLAARAPGRELAWDCGTGSGQAAGALAEHFECVLGTDASSAQLAHARQHARVRYACMTAERSALRSSAFQLVTGAQALHWFDVAQFFREAKRVLVPGGLIAIWSYGLLRITPALDDLLLRFYRDELGPFWPAERSLVEAGYAGLELPFEEILVPEVRMQAQWTLLELGGYLSSWSAVSRYQTARGENPVVPLVERLRSVWGPLDERRVIEWPLTIRAGISVD